MDRVVQRVRERLAQARKVLVISGAGISAESGVPTFRGAGGVWNNKDLMRLASPEGFAEDPARAWTWYDGRRRQLAGCVPNPAHRALVDLERCVPDFLIATQNVDQLHEAAGSRAIEHVHGSIWNVRCTAARCPRSRGETYYPAVPLPEIPPRCACGALLRPAVVWFGEILPAEPLERIDRFIRSGAVDSVLAVGTMAVFPYIVAWALLAQRLGACLVEINPEPTDLSHAADIRLIGKAGDLLPQVVGSAADPR